MTRIGLKLQESEAVVVMAAANIYAGYVIAGKPSEQALEDSIKTAIKIATRLDDLIRSDKELG